MRILITGAGGFVGHHLANHLGDSQPTATLCGTTLFREESVSPAIEIARQIDLKEARQARDLLGELAPDVIYHLAAQAFVPRSFDDPWETLENNIRSQLNIIQGCLALDLRPRTVIISSAEIYGAVSPAQLPLDEGTEIRPTNPYSVSKVAQDMLALQFHLSHGLAIMRARPFNHIGPGQNRRFVAPAFAIQIAKIEANRQAPVIYVGNLEAKRDFTDVRDIVRAYKLIAEKGAPGEAYNIASGRASSVGHILNSLLGMTDIEIEVRVDPARLRPVDIPEIRGDAGKLRRDTGWAPRFTLQETLTDVLADCRRRVHSA
ncbi:MAG: GDP-mannose 4,6-dehydratase [Chloroflexi bacterium]|nr:GDP-mannose 4,6-dehydratase [Chloroflexota bacterium]